MIAGSQAIGHSKLVCCPLISGFGLLFMAHEIEHLGKVLRCAGELVSKVGRSTSISTGSTALLSIVGARQLFYGLKIKSSYHYAMLGGF